VLMASALKEIQQIYTTQDTSLYSTLAKKLVQVAGLLEENNYTSEVDRVTTLPSEDIGEVVGLGNIKSELNLRITRVTARILNIWKKILSPQREAAVISCSFLLLYCEVDGSLKILPTARIPADKAVNSMKNYLNNPGYVVTIIRKTKEYIENEQISVETIRRINDLIGKITVEQVKNMDKTLTGFAIYELVLYAVRYYQEYAKDNYKIDIFEEPEERLFGSEEKSKESFERSPFREEVKISAGEDTGPRIKTAKVIARSPEKVKIPERNLKVVGKVGDKPLRSPEKNVKSLGGKLPERSRIVEKNSRSPEKVALTHHKSRSALYSPAASSTKDSTSRLQRNTSNTSNSSNKNLLTERKSLNIFRK